MILKFPFRSSFHVEIANAIQEEHHIRVESVDYDISMPLLLAWLACNRMRVSAST